MSAAIAVVIVLVMVITLGALYFGGVLKFSEEKDSKETPPGGVNPGGENPGGENPGGENPGGLTVNNDANSTGNERSAGNSSPSGDYQEFQDGFQETPILPPIKKALNEACEETSECNSGLECRVVDESGTKKCKRIFTSDRLPGADRVTIPGTELGEISAIDKFFIRNRHKGRCLGRGDEDKLIHSKVGERGETLPCDTENPDFHWERLDIQGTNRKKFRLVDTDLCLALNGHLNKTQQYPEGIWGNSTMFSLVSCTDRPNKATAIEIVPEPPESGMVDGELFVPAPYYSLKTYSSKIEQLPGTKAQCMWLSGGQDMQKARIKQCEESRLNDTMHFNFPKIV